MDIVKLSEQDLDYLNTRLLNTYGRWEDHPKYQLVWSDDQYEKRWTKYGDSGIELVHPEVREVFKYPQARHRYVLEMAMPIPDFARTDLTTKFSYEPIWTFEDKKRQFLPPRWDAIYFIIEQVQNAAARAVGVKYKDPTAGLKSEVEEHQKQELDEIYQELFGNETDVTDALAYKEGISVPHNYERDKE